MFGDWSSSRTTLSSIPLLSFFTSSRTQQSSGSEKLWKFTPYFPSRNRSAQTEGLNSLAVDGTTINFSPFSWAERPPGEKAPNQARKAWVSLVLVIKMGALLGYCPVGKQVFASWACWEVSSGLSLRGPDISLDMRLMAVLSETAGSDRSEPLVVGLCNPLAWNEATVGYPQLC